MLMQGLPRSGVNGKTTQKGERTSQVYDDRTLVTEFTLFRKNPYRMDCFVSFLRTDQVALEALR